jgi:hypothetical protein
MVLHALDHVFQGRGLSALSPEVLGGGILLLVLAVATFPLTLRAHPQATVVAAALGWSIALGVSASHLLPYWSAFSDPYVDLSLGAYSWSVMLAEVIAAAVFGSIAVRSILHSRRLRLA